MKRPSVNALAAAILAACPLAPSEEWQTATELAPLLNMSRDAVRIRLENLVKQGKAERMVAARRVQTGGTAIYYRMKP